MELSRVLLNITTVLLGGEIMCKKQVFNQQF